MADWHTPKGRERIKLRYALCGGVCGALAMAVFVAALGAI